MTEWILAQAFEAQGAWRLPDTEQWLPGTLRYRPGEEIQLDLFGAPAITEEQPLGRAHWDIILGVTTNGTPVTLRECVQLNLSIGKGGIPQSSFRATWAIFGSHFPTDDSVRFKWLSGSYAYLDQFVGVTGLSLERSELTSTQISFRQPDGRELEVDASLRVRFGFSFHLVPSPFAARIEQTTWVTAERTAAANLDDLLVQLGHVQNLVGLAAGKFATPLQINGLPEQSSEWERRRSTQVVFVPRPAEGDDDTDITSLFTLSDLEPDIGDALERWFAAADLVKPTFDLYFSTLSIPFIYAENQFLSLAQAAESFHRRRFPIGEVSAEEHESRVAAVLAAVPVEHRKWLAQKLAYSNEPNLRSRLKALLQPHPALRKALRGASFVNRVVDTRNYLTHYDERSRKNAAEGVRLHWLVEKLRIVVEMCLLTELGLSSSRIAMILLRQSRNQYALSQQS